MYEKHFVEHYFIFILQGFIELIYVTINRCTGIHVFKDYHSFFVYPLFRYV